MIDNKIKFSIITVCYNSEQTLAKTIESVIKQSYKNFEYIIIDGCSSDKTIPIIDSYKEILKDKLRVISEKDNGIYDAMNKGISFADGNYISFLNSDDWYEEDTLSIVANIISKNPNKNVYYGNLNLVKSETNSITIKPIKISYMPRSMSIFHPSSFGERELFLKVGKFDTMFKLSADYDFFLRVFKSDFSFFYINSVLSNYRLIGASYTNRNLGLRENHLIRKKNGINPLMASIYYIREKYFSSLKGKLAYFMKMRKKFKYSQKG